MKRCFCTIITQDYLPYALTLYASLFAFDPETELHVLITDQGLETPELSGRPRHVQLHGLRELCGSGIGQAIYQKYARTEMDHFRWSMKPVLMNYLLRTAGYERVIFADCDLFFFQGYDFLWDQLETQHILLSPHWRCSTPFMLGVSSMEQLNFQMLYNKGIYNGGFVGANQAGTTALDWWAQACEYICVKDEARGFFVDQVHLNLLPVLFDRVGVIRHKGCNIANWNQVDCKRQTDENGQVKINGIWDIVFIHFTPSTIFGILYENDGMLQPYLEKYERVLKMQDPAIDLRARVAPLLAQAGIRASVFRKIKNKIAPSRR